MRSHLVHVSSLHRPAEFPPQFMGAVFDHRIVGDANHRAVGAIQGHRNSGGLLKQLIQLLLKRRGRFIHESASGWGMIGLLNPQGAASYHRIGSFRY
jgi:hypothetical protein